MEFKTLLSEEIANELEELGKDGFPSEEYKARVEGVTKLMDRRIEMEKLEIESDIQQNRAYLEYEIENRKLDEAKKDRVTKVIYGVGTLCLTFVGYAVGTILTNNFEKEGTYLNSSSKEWHKKMFNFKRSKD